MLKEVFGGFRCNRLFLQTQTVQNILAVSRFIGVTSIACRTSSSATFNLSHEGSARVRQVKCSAATSSASCLQHGQPACLEYVSTLEPLKIPLEFSPTCRTALAARQIIYLTHSVMGADWGTVKRKVQENGTSFLLLLFVVAKSSSVELSWFWFEFESCYKPPMWLNAVCNCCFSQIASHFRMTLYLSYVISFDTSIRRLYHGDNSEVPIWQKKKYNVGLEITNAICIFVLLQFTIDCT